MKRILFVLGISLFAMSLVNAKPTRDKGLSMHMVPERVAEIDKQKWGLLISEIFCQRYNKPEETFQSSAEMLKYFKSLPQEIKENGIWIVITNPDAYSEKEKAVFESVKQECMKERIIFFVCRGSKLPDGWIDGGVFSIENNDNMYLAKETVDIGWQSFKQNDLEKALKSFNEAINIDPNFAPAYFGRAYVYSVQDKLDLAIENYRKSIEKYPLHSNSYNNLGLDLLKSNKLDEALAMFQKALEIDPANGNVHANIAYYYFEIKDYKICWKHINLAEQLKVKIDSELLEELKAKMPKPE